MPDAMSIEQAAEYLREKLPKGWCWFLNIGTWSDTPTLYAACVRVWPGDRRHQKDFNSRAGFSAPVRAAVDWAKGQAQPVIARSK